MFPAAIGIATDGGCKEIALELVEVPPSLRLSCGCELDHPTASRLPADPAAACSDAASCRARAAAARRRQRHHQWLDRARTQAVAARRRLLRSICHQPLAPVL